MPQPPDKPPRRPLRPLPEPPAAAGAPPHAELHCVSSFSFQRGASLPDELVDRALALGLPALAITDACSVAGVVRAWSRLREHQDEARRAGREPPQLKLLYGSEFAWQPPGLPIEGVRLVALARDREGWGGLCECITAFRRDGGLRQAAPPQPLAGDRADEAAGQLGLDLVVSDEEGDALPPAGPVLVGHDDPWPLLAGCELILLPPRLPALPATQVVLAEALRRAVRQFGSGSLWLGVALHHDAPDDAAWLALLMQLESTIGTPCVAVGDVHFHVRSRKPLQDVLTALRVKRTVDACGFDLKANAEHHLRRPASLARLYPPPLLARTHEVAARCGFQLDEIRYDYPLHTVPPGLTPLQALARLTALGARRRYPRERFPGGTPRAVRRLLVKELKLIGQCDYAMFFLTVEDIVRFARREGILCQGRGSAANSAVCFVLGITAVDPLGGHLLLERFISPARKNEPPDIDVDFEHERREVVIQYIYRTYGRDRSALAATVIAYRSRSALRDVGGALGLPAGLVDAFAKDHHWFDPPLMGERLAQLAADHGVDIADHRLTHWLDLAQQLMGQPRHLSQHVGGFVLTETRLTRLVPVENAAMPERSIIQWDKDDLEALGMLKVDVLALGMLTALRRALELRQRWRGGPLWDLADIPAEDPATYEMACQADTVGVFQIESRAQMSMLPRLQPRTFYDLVIEVAIVRPGPIQGGMVHPFLKARERLRRGLPIEFEHDDLRPALERTLGVPIFQEQVMQIAMIAAGFTGEEADRLRRAMAAWKRKGGVQGFRDQIVGGMTARGYSLDFAERIFQQMLGFGDYGFPESHAASFALLTYASTWLKCHEPACFVAALLNSQPMGFYAPSQLVQDLRRRGIQVRPADVGVSDFDCTLEAHDADARPAVAIDRRLARGDADQPALRLGLRLVKGLPEEAAHRIAAARSAAGPFADVQDLAQRARLDAGDLRALAGADALASLAGHRRQQVWEASARGVAARQRPALIDAAPIHEDHLELPSAPEGEEVLFDHARTGLTLRRHPVAILRQRLDAWKLKTAAELQSVPGGRRVRAGGLVTMRQQPATANGTVFVTLEDETGVINVIVWKHVREAQREALLRSRLLAVRGLWQCETAGRGAAPVRHLIAEDLRDLSPLLGRLAELRNPSRDFH